MLSKMPSNKAQKSDEQILEAQGQHDEPLRLDMLMPVKQETSYEDISADRLEESKMREKAIIDRLKFENDTDGYELDAARRRISSDISPISCGPVKEEICYEGIIKEEHGDSEMQDKSIIDKLKFENDTEEYQIDAARRRISSDASPTSCGTAKQDTSYEAKSEAHHGDSDANKENLRRGPPKRGRNAGRAGPLLSIPSGSRDGNSAANVQSSRGKRGGGKTRSSRKRGVQAGQARGRAGGAQKRPLAQNEENLEESPLGSSLDAPPFAKRRKSLDQDQNFKLPKYDDQPLLSTSAAPTDPPQPYAPPSPTAFIECEMTRTPRSIRLSHGSRQPVIYDDISLSSCSFLHYGSEEESESDDEEGYFSFGVRVERAEEETAQDTEEEAVAAAFDVPAEEVDFDEAAEEVNFDEAAEEVDFDEAAEEVNGVMHEPTTLFNFNWQVYPKPPISSRLRREQFVGVSGPMIDPIPSVYDAFVAIWDRTIMEHIVRETNYYAQQYCEELLRRGEIGPRSLTHWKDTDVDELYVFFALVMAMGLVVKSQQQEEYWFSDSTSPDYTPFFSSVMPLNRFLILFKCLHFNRSDAPSLQNLTPSQAKLFKIEPIVRHLNAKFSSLYGLDQSIALDESLTQWRRGHNIKQNIPNKAAEVDVKTYEVCDCRSGYLWRFECHVGREVPDQGIEWGSIPNLVLRLLRGLEYRGHTVWMNDYYNSPALARVLKSKGYDCAGTLRTDRQFVPVALYELRKQDMVKGHLYGTTSGDVDLLVYGDPNRVGLISTYHGSGVCKRKPVIVQDYKICMGGVDRKDHMLSWYPMERTQTRVWYKKFFRRLLNVSILNAFILYEHTHDITQREFRRDLVQDLIKHHRATIPSINVGTHRVLTDEVMQHFPSSLTLMPNSDKHGGDRRLCVHCKVKSTNFICRGCDVTLCADFTKPAEEVCFLQYHKTNH